MVPFSGSGSPASQVICEVTFEGPLLPFEAIFDPELRAFEAKVKVTLRRLDVKSELSPTMSLVEC